MEKLDTIVIGATGAAGQNIVEFIDEHPWFEISCLAASDRSHGLKYQDAVEDAAFFNEKPGDDVLEMKVYSVNKIDPRNYDVAFSALPSDVAKTVEPMFAKHIPVISTASAYRYDQDVPIVIPDVNPEHIQLVDAQRRNRGWKGFIVPGPNCTTVGLASTLKPLHEKYVVDKVSMVSMQSLSGAGEKGLKKDSPYRASVVKNVLPFIEGEEMKVAAETRKILGEFSGGGIVEADITVHSTCTRVYVDAVHTEVVNLGTLQPHSVNEVKRLLSRYRSEPQELGLPSAPEQPIIVVDEVDMPQPLKHKEYPTMVTLVGRLRENDVFENGLSYVLTSDNLERGAGGGAVLTAEYLYVKGYL
ncbi:aspartate-semialdehyde dehydrogenase [Candidatus Bathyarchaeota archaeon]|nr:aspartate-semialdehyde dehydrogenase [Candidatus Bathyarchaeota archaeon]